MGYIDNIVRRRAFDINSINGIMNSSLVTSWSGPNGEAPGTYGQHPIDGTNFTAADIMPVAPEMIDLLNDFANNHTYHVA